MKVGIVKLGCLGTVPLLEFLLDERADREDVDVRVVGSGAKLGIDQSIEAATTMVNMKPDLVVLVGPAQQTAGPKEARRILVESGIPTVVISDSPMKRIREELESEGVGYIVVEADPMIGARREFLDPIEMAIFNSDVIRLLACVGVFNAIIDIIDSLIEDIKRGEEPKLPRKVINKDAALEAAEFENPYARAKALAAHEVARNVATVNIEACFKEREWIRYTTLTASAHEMLRYASKLAEEAREIEKSSDMVLRRPHHKDGSRRVKRKLLEKPTKEN